MDLALENNTSNPQSILATIWGSFFGFRARFYQTLCIEWAGRIDIVLNGVREAWRVKQTVTQVQLVLFLGGLKKKWFIDQDISPEAELSAVDSIQMTSSEQGRGYIHDFTPTGSDESIYVLGVPVAILPFCPNVKNIAL